MSKLIGPPPLPSLHAQERVEGGEITVRDFAFSPRNAPEALIIFRPLDSEGAGNAGRPMRPIAACAMLLVETHTRCQVTPESPGIPHAMVYGL